MTIESERENKFVFEMFVRDKTNAKDAGKNSPVNNTFFYS